MLMRKNALRAKTRLGDDILAEKEVPYAERKKSVFDVYRPKTEGALPVIVYFHGDAMAHGSKEHRKGFCARLAREGYAVLNVEYEDASVAGGFEKCVSGAECALRWLGRDTSGRFDLGHVVLAGDAVGALIAFTLAARSHDGIDIVGVMGYCGVYDVPELFSKDVKFNLQYEVIRDMFGISGKNGFTEEETRRIRATAMQRLVTPDFPPALVAHSDYDKIVPGQGDSICATLVAKGVPVTEFKAVYAHCGHNFQLERSACSERLALVEKEFLGTVTKVGTIQSKYIEV